MRNIDTINEAIIHALATPPDWFAGHTNAEKQVEVRRWHVKERGWRAEGYNWFIWRDGEVTVGRDIDQDGDTWEEVGAHVKGHNLRSLGIVLEGGFGGSANDKFLDNFTPEQEMALAALLGKIQHKLGDIKISGHNQYANKACPCFNVPNWLAGKERVPRTNIVQSKTIQASQVAKLATVASPVVGTVAGLPWQNLLIMGVFALVVLVALGVIDVERFKKWNAGDK